jgi:ATP-dependent DNA ligase
MASKGANARRLAATRPANYVVFDLIAYSGGDLRRSPLRDRRQRLEQLFDGVGPPLVLSPATTDRGQAEAWLERYAAAHVGIEGVVAKGLAQPYRSGARDW